MVHRKIRWSLIEIWSIDERIRLRHDPSIRAHDRPIQVGPAGARFCNDRRDADKTIRRQRVNRQLVVSLVCERVVAAQRKPSRKASRETDDETIVVALIPWTKRANRSRGEWRQKLAARSARRKRDVRFTQAQQVVHVPMIVISFDDDVFDLLLHTDADAARERRLEAAIDIGGKQLRRNRRMRQRAKRSPEKEARRFADCRRSLKQILIGRQPRQRLNVAEIDHRVRRNKRMTRRYDAIESIDADEQTRRKRTSEFARRDLCIS